MKINVCIKQVPDPEKFPVGQFNAAGRLARDSFPKATNPLDKNACELALNLSDVPEDVTAFSMGPESVKETLREALAMGIGNAVLINDQELEGSDLLSTAITLASAMKKHGEFDIIVCGAKSTDAEMGILPAMIADILNIPSVLGAEKVRVEGNNAYVSVPSENGTNVWKVNLPCVVSVTKNINTPRLPSLRGMNKAMKIPITEYTADDLDLELPDAKPKLLEHTPVSTQSQIEFIKGESADEIANKLITAIKMKGVLS
ncbi:MAG: electron transfer flavoprotein subunit beta/FixA family protein [Caldisericia bacterium]